MIFDRNEGSLKYEPVCVEHFLFKFGSQEPLIQPTSRVGSPNETLFLLILNLNFYRPVKNIQLRLTIRY